MKTRGKYRVLLMCKTCDKVYNGTMPTTYEHAMKVYHNTMMHNKDVCKKCDEELVPYIQEENKKK